MSEKLEEITGVYSAQVFPKPGVDGDYIIGRIRPLTADNKTSCSEISVLGNLEGDKLEIGHQYRFYGRWENGTGAYSHTRQFKFQTFIKPTPAGREGTIRYLADCPNIGLGFACTLWNKFGSQAIRFLRELPEVAAAAVPRLSEAHAKEASNHLKSQQQLESATVDLIDLLGGRGLPRTLAKKCIEEWGNKAATTVRRNPYLLMNFHGCGFLRTDSLFIDLGGNPSRLKRQALCAWHSIASKTDGHTWSDLKTVEEGLRSKLSGAVIDGPRACLLAKRAKILSMRRDADGNLWFAEGKKARAEEYVAKRVSEWQENDRQKREENGVQHWTEIDGRFDFLSDHQREKLAAAISGTIGSLGGSPGTGKTTVAAKLIAALIADHGTRSVAIAAPTGKAAVRISEAMNGHGVSVQARTIHSLLGVQHVNAIKGWTFNHNEIDPLSFKFVVIDECSMCDCSLMASLLAAIGKGTRLLLVGDVNQLAPVGHGAPLRDLIAAGIPYGELREIRRNSGRIVQACAEMRDGSVFRDSTAIDIDAGENLKVVAANTPAQQIERMFAAIEVAGRDGCDPIWDVQVIVPVNARSPIARKALNKMLQARLNPNGQQASGSPFRVGDKVVCLKNQYTPISTDYGDDNELQKNDNGKIFVANGEQGEVLQVATKKTIVKLSGPTRYVLIPRGVESKSPAGEGDGEGSESGDADGGDSGKSGTGTGCDWDLAFAVSCHKSQGSEYPITIVMVDEYPGAKMVCDRSWVYTAVSRAKRLCLLIGRKYTADMFCSHMNLANRKTFLVELIKSETEKLACERAGEISNQSSSREFATAGQA